MVKKRKQARQRNRYQIRKIISGTQKRPRIAVFRSLNHFCIQAIDDENGHTLTQASSLDPKLLKKLKGQGGNLKAAQEVGNLMAQRMKDNGLKTGVYDRGGFLYHGRVKAAAEALRKGGIKL